MRIFISYGHDVFADLPERISADLSALGHNVWFDKDRLEVGTDYEARIEEALNWCAQVESEGCVMLFMTPHSVRRPDGYCLNEVAAAINRRLSIIPVMMVWCEPPLSICRLQWLDMRDCVPLAQHEDRYRSKLSKLIAAAEKGVLDFEGSQASLLRHLNPIDFSTEIARHVPDFVGREWLFRRIDAWLSDPKGTRIFWLVGGPGVGKSAVAAYLCHTRPEVGAFHFCSYGHDDKSDPRRCVMSLAYQLSSQLPEYRTHLAAMDLRAEVLKSAATLFDNLIVQPLAPPFPAPDRMILIVIDALDEATRNGKNELAEFVGQAFHSTPAWVRLLVTSRPESEVMEPLQGIRPFRFDADGADNLHDLRTYLRGQFSSRGVAPGHLDATIEPILRKSEGTFLYADRVISELDGDPGHAPDLSSLPQGVAGVFQKYMTRQFADVDQYRTQVRPLVEMIVAARGPLPVPFVQQTLGWDEYQTRDVLQSLGSLVTTRDGGLGVFHQSLREWLVSHERAGRYFASFSEGNRHIADACWDEFGSGNSKTMCNYCMDHLPLHLLELERWDQLLHLVTDPVLALMDRWNQRGGGHALGVLERLVSHFQGDRKYRTTVAGLSSQIGRLYSIRGDYDEAETWLQRVLAQTSWWRGRRIRAVALHELASIRLYHGEGAAAMRLFKRALRLCFLGRSVHHDEAAANLVGMASVARAELRFAKALRYARRAIREAKRDRDAGHEISSRRIMAAVYATLGNFNEAELQVRQALSLCRQHHNRLEEGRALMVLGAIGWKRDAAQDQISPVVQECFQQALVAADESDDWYSTVEAKLSLGAFELAHGRADRAAPWIEPLETAPLSGRHAELSAALEFHRGALAQLRGDLALAQSQYECVIALCRDTHLPMWLARVMVARGGLYWHSGDRVNAEATWREAKKEARAVSRMTETIARHNIRRCRANVDAIPR